MDIMLDEFDKYDKKDLRQYKIDCGFGIAYLTTPYDPTERFPILANTCFGLRKSWMCCDILSVEIVDEDDYEHLWWNGDEYIWRKDGARKMIYPPLNDSFQNYKNDMLDPFKEYTQEKVKEFDEMIFNELKKHGIEDLKDFSRVQAIPQMTHNEGIEVESRWYVDGEHVFDLCKRTSRMYKSGMIYEFQVEYFIRKDE